MNAINEILFALVREGVQIENADDNWVTELVSRPGFNLEEVFSLAVQQGLGAITYDGVQRWVSIPAIQSQLQKSLKLQWGMVMMQTEQRFAQQWSSAKLLSDYYHEHNIQTIVLKGFAVAQYYPHPNHRACGDLDCFLQGDYEKGNQLVAEKGIEISRDFYKHAEFDVQNLHVENHQFCTAIRGSHKAKDFERLLQNLLKEEPSTAILDSNLSCPSPLFNALFLTKHAFGHFLSEGITLRHYLDWSMFIVKNKDEVDWSLFISTCKKYGLFTFVNVLTALCEHLYHVKSPFVLTHFTALEQRMFEDTLCLGDKDGVNQGTFWEQRLKLLKNIYKDKWKYSYFSEDSFVFVMLRYAWGYLFDRKPKL